KTFATARDPRQSEKFTRPKEANPVKTSCHHLLPTGIAYTFMAAERAANRHQGRGHLIAPRNSEAIVSCFVVGMGPWK
ncbi:MAG: hypothetical protein K9K38_23045, partial [Rhodoferax sp.]|nr:hypothetical protein [Rhodoferax sp.]